MQYRMVYGINKNVTEQEQQALSSMQKALLLLQLGRPINTAIIH